MYILWLPVQCWVDGRIPPERRAEVFVFWWNSARLMSDLVRGILRVRHDTGIGCFWQNAARSTGGSTVLVEFCQTSARTLYFCRNSGRIGPEFWQNSVLPEVALIPPEVLVSVLVLSNPVLVNTGSLHFPSRKNEYEYRTVPTTYYRVKIAILAVQYPRPTTVYLLRHRTPNARPLPSPPLPSPPLPSPYSTAYCLLMPMPPATCHLPTAYRLLPTAYCLSAYCLSA